MSESITMDDFIAIEAHINTIMKDSKDSVRFFQRCFSLDAHKLTTGKFYGIAILYFKIATRTGFRVSEILNMRWSDVITENPLDKKISARQIITIDKDRMKGKKNSRRIRLGKHLSYILKLYWNDIYQLIYGKRPSLNKYIFASTRSNGILAVSTIHRYLVKLFRICNIDAVQLGYSSHSFRKFFIRNIYKTVKDLNKLRAYTGHASLSSLTNYLETDEQFDDAGAVKFIDG